MVMWEIPLVVQEAPVASVGATHCLLGHILVAFRHSEVSAPWAGSFLFTVAHGAQKSEVLPHG